MRAIALVAVVKILHVPMTIAGLENNLLWTVSGLLWRDGKTVRPILYHAWLVLSENSSRRDSRSVAHRFVPARHVWHSAFARSSSGFVVAAGRQVRNTAS